MLRHSTECSGRLAESASVGGWRRHSCARKANTRCRNLPCRSEGRQGPRSSALALPSSSTSGSRRRGRVQLPQTAIARRTRRPSSLREGRIRFTSPRRPRQKGSGDEARPHPWGRRLHVFMVHGSDWSSLTSIFTPCVAARQRLHAPGDAFLEETAGKRCPTNVRNEPRRLIPRHCRALNLFHAIRSPYPEPGGLTDVAACRPARFLVTGASELLDRWALAILALASEQVINLAEAGDVHRPHARVIEAKA